MADELSEIVANAAKKTREVEERKRLQQQARAAKLRAKEVKARQEAQEKLVAPVLLLVTILISAVVMVLSR